MGKQSEMVRIDSDNENLLIDTEKVITNEENYEHDKCSHLHTSASSSCRNGDEDMSPFHSGSTPCSIVNDVGLVLSDRRIRRQIANCNERRRMQSINAGFQSLRSLLPKKNGEKMSKAAILQQTVELIQTLQADKEQLLEEKAEVEMKKRKLRDVEESERDLVEKLKCALEKEQGLRQFYEQQIRELRATSPLISPIAATSQLQLTSSLINSPLMQSHVAVGISSLLPQTLSVDNSIVSSPYLRHESFISTPSTFSSITTGIDRDYHDNKKIIANSAEDILNGKLVTNESSLPIQSQLLVNSMENHSAAIFTHRNLNAIVEAIRYLEGRNIGTPIAASSASSNNTTLAQKSNVLVR